MSEGPKRSILDQNGIKLLNPSQDYGQIILSPMFFWEFFNNCGTKLESDLLSLIKPFSKHLLVTYKSTTCESRETKRRKHLKFREFIDKGNTNTVRNWLQLPQPKIHQLRDILSPGLTSAIFNSSYATPASNSWLPYLQSEFVKFANSNERMSFRNNFNELDDKTTQNLLENSIRVCFEILKRKGYTKRQSIIFLSSPSILFNRVFGIIGIHQYRSTHTDSSYRADKIANDFKDSEYLFIAHLCDNIIGQDAFFVNLYKHLKKSHHILRNTATGL